MVLEAAVAALPVAAARDAAASRCTRGTSAATTSSRMTGRYYFLLFLPFVARPVLLCDIVIDQSMNWLVINFDLLLDGQST
jgi:hypothetical protein